MSPHRIQLAGDLSLPLELVTESVAILAKRRAGKSTTARRMAEQLHRAGQQVVVADPKGDWWGLRFARDGKSPGLPFIVLGGEHADVPLEVSAGELVAKLVVTQRVSVVLDLSKFRKHEVATFMTAFMETLYRLKAQEQYRTPVALIVDEADAIAPQKPQRGEERMLGAAEDLVRRGGQRGIGVVMITQRSAVLNKNVLTQIGILVVLRTIAPQDLAAMDAWIDVHGTVEQRRELMASLPSLPTGEGWVWAPGWPTAEGIFQRSAFLLPKTFDSSATPKVGEERVQPKNPAEVDLEAFRRDMAATIERAKQEDPKALRAELGQLRRQLTVEQKKLQAPATARAAKEVEKRVEVAILKDGHIARVDKFGERLVQFGTQMTQDLPTQIGEKIAAAVAPVVTIGREITAALARLHHPSNGVAKGSVGPHAMPAPRPSVPPSRPPVPRSAPAGARQVPHVPAEGVSGPQQRILDALAWFESIGLERGERTQVALLADASPTSSAYANNLGALRTAALIDYPAGGVLALTATGRAAAAAPERPPTTAELHETLYRRLPSPQGRILSALIDAYPAALDRDRLAELAEASATSSAYANNLGALRSLGLIEYPARGHVAARSALFLEV